MGKRRASEGLTRDNVDDVERKLRQNENAISLDNVTKNVIAQEENTDASNSGPKNLKTTEQLSSPNESNSFLSSTTTTTTPEILESISPRKNEDATKPSSNDSSQTLQKNKILLPPSNLSPKNKDDEGIHLEIISVQPNADDIHEERVQEHLVKETADTLTCSANTSEVHLEDTRSAKRQREGSFENVDSSPASSLVNSSQNDNTEKGIAAKAENIDNELTSSLNTENEKDGVKSSISIQDKGMFGTLFTQPFTNPLAEAAKSNKGGFSPFTSKTDGTEYKGESLFGKFSILSESAISWNAQPAATNSNNETTNNEDDSATTSTPRPPQFPGEEDDAEELLDSNVILMKCVPIEDNVQTKRDRNTSANEEDTSEIKAESLTATGTKKPSMKFKKLGEGLLKVLSPSDVPCEEKHKRRRLVIRQKGTWSLLLNSPLWLSQHFEPVSPGCKLRFVALNMQKGSEITADLESSNKPVSLAAYCIKFDSESKRKTFLDVVGSDQIQEKH